MSTIKVTNLRHESASSSNITLDSSNNAVVAGTLGCTGNLTVTSGNLVVSSGNGIDFSATSGTGTSELFDDYEEGSWTPTILMAATTEVSAYAAQTGRYRKIGSMVVAMCNVGVSGNQTGGNTGNLYVGGLPFTATALNIATTVHSEGLSNLTTQSLMFQLDSGQTKVVLRSFTSGTFSPLTHSNIQGAGFQGFNFVATYLA